MTSSSFDSSKVVPCESTPLGRVSSGGPVPQAKKKSSRSFGHVVVKFLLVCIGVTVYTRLSSSASPSSVVDQSVSKSVNKVNENDSIVFPIASLAASETKASLRQVDEEVVSTSTDLSFTTQPTCSNFGGIDTRIPGTRCCPRSCGDKCGAGNCNQGTNCCKEDAVGKVCGRDPLPCNKPTPPTCSNFGGIDTRNPGTRCCPRSCGDKCGAGNCNQGTNCCKEDAVGKVCGRDPLPCHML